MPPPWHVGKQLAAAAVACTLLAAVFLAVWGTGWTGRQTASVGFSDVPPDRADYAQILNLQRRGIFVGFPDGTFRGDSLLTRVEFAAILVRWLRPLPASCERLPFPDLEPNAWYLPSVCDAKAAGYVSGRPDGTLDPASPVTFAEAAKMAAIGFQQVRPDARSQPGDPWYRIYIEALARIGAVPATVHDPGQHLDRYEIAAILSASVDAVPAGGAASSQDSVADGTPGVSDALASMAVHQAAPPQSVQSAVSQSSSRPASSEIQAPPLPSSSAGNVGQVSSEASEDPSEHSSSAAAQDPISSSAQAASSAAAPQSSSIRYESFSVEDIVAGPGGKLWYAKVESRSKTGYIGSIAPDGTVTEYRVPGQSMPFRIAAGPDSTLWFTDRYASGPLSPVVRKMTPEGAFTEYAHLAIGGMPSAITSGPDGNLWFADGQKFSGNAIVKMTPGGAITRYPLPGYGNPTAIAAGSDGNLWFADASINRGGSKVGRITPAGVITEYALPESPADAFYQGMTAGPDGNVWLAEFGDGAAIYKVTPSGALTRYPVAAQSLSGIAAGPDGNLWCAMGSLGGIAQIGRITPAGAVTAYQDGNERIVGVLRIAAGHDSALWFTAASNRIGKITTGGAVTTYDLPRG